MNTQVNAKKQKSIANPISSAAAKRKAKPNKTTNIPACVISALFISPESPSSSA
jgi:hypothetical protein